MSLSIESPTSGERASSRGRDGVIGHDVLVSELEVSLPQVSFFLGPRSVGKTTTAFYLASFHGIADTDFLYVPDLNSDSAETIRFLSAVPPRDGLRLIVVDLDSSRDTDKDSLLRVIEEPAVTTKFILISSHAVSTSLLSRGLTFRFPLLSTEAVEEILRGALSESANVGRLAYSSGGQVFRALQSFKDSEVRSEVVQLLRAFSSGDLALPPRSIQVWTYRHNRFLEIWCHEILTTRWRVFSPQETELTDRQLAIRLLIGLRRNIRPRLFLRSIVADMLREYNR